MRKPLFRVSLVLAFMALLCGTALAQPAQPDIYVAVSYIKILPGQEEAYRAFLAATSPALLGWNLARVMYTGMEHGTDYDYVAAALFSGPPPEPGANTNAIAMKVAGMSQADLGKKLATMRTIVGTEVLRRRAGSTAPVALKEGDFRIIARIKTKPGMGDEYYQMAQTLTQPVMEARAAAGELKSWSVWSRVIPSGAGTSYDALAVTYFKDLASAIKGLDPAKGIAAFQKVHPGKNYATYINNGRDYSELQQRFVMQVVAMVERAK